MASNINTAIPPLGSPTTSGVRSNFSAAKTEIETLQSNVTIIESDIATIESNISILNSTIGAANRSIFNSQSVTGGTSKPTFGTVGGVPSASVVIGTMNAVVSYTDPLNSPSTGIKRIELWTFPGATITPTFSGNVLTDATRLFIVPDFTTKDTTRLLKVVEHAKYSSPTQLEKLHACWYAALTRSLTTFLIDPSTPASIANFILSPSLSNSEKIKMISIGPERISGYKITGEVSPPITGSYFAISNGSALTLGRNQSVDLFDTYFLFDDPAVTGGQSNQTFAQLGRGVSGSDGKSLNRATGTAAYANLTTYEPVDANSAADFVAIPSGKWAIYKIYYVPGSRLLSFGASITTYTTSALGIADSHIYDNIAYSKMDRWVLAMHLGYVAIKQGFNPIANWATNTGLFQFYDVQKTAY